MSRTLFTGVFPSSPPLVEESFPEHRWHATPNSSASTLAPFDIYEPYNSRLKKVHLALSILPDVIAPSSRPSSPEFERRIQEHKQHLIKLQKESVSFHDFGRVFCTQLRGVGVSWRQSNSLDEIKKRLRMSTPPLVDTEEEWKAWEVEQERKHALEREEQEQRRASEGEAIETWRKGILPASQPPVTNPVSTKRKKISPLGFKVVKSQSHSQESEKNDPEPPPRPRKVASVPTVSNLDDIYVPSSQPPPADVFWQSESLPQGPAVVDETDELESLPKEEVGKPSTPSYFKPVTLVSHPSPIGTDSMESIDQLSQHTSLHEDSRRRHMEHMMTFDSQLEGETSPRPAPLALRLSDVIHVESEGQDDESPPFRVPGSAQEPTQDESVDPYRPPSFIGIPTSTQLPAAIVGARAEGEAKPSLRTLPNQREDEQAPSFAQVPTSTQPRGVVIVENSSSFTIPASPQLPERVPETSDEASPLPPTMPSFTGVATSTQLPRTETELISDDTSLSGPNTQVIEDEDVIESPSFNGVPTSTQREPVVLVENSPSPPNRRERDLVSLQQRIPPPSQSQSSLTTRPFFSKGGTLKVPTPSAPPPAANEDANDDIRFFVQTNGKKPTRIPYIPSSPSSTPSTKRRAEPYSLDQEPETPTKIRRTAPEDDEVPTTPSMKKPMIPQRTPTRTPLPNLTDLIRGHPRPRTPSKFQFTKMASTPSPRTPSSGKPQPSAIANIPAHLQDLITPFGLASPFGSPSPNTQRFMNSSNESPPSLKKPKISRALGPQSSGLVGMDYNSQFQIEDNVEAVSRFLESDMWEGDGIEDDDVD